MRKNQLQIWGVLNMELLEPEWKSLGTPKFPSLSLYKIDIIYIGVPRVPYVQLIYGSVMFPDQKKVFRILVCLKTSKMGTPGTPIPKKGVTLGESVTYRSFTEFQTSSVAVSRSSRTAFFKRNSLQKGVPNG